MFLITELYCLGQHCTVFAQFAINRPPPPPPPNKAAKHAYLMSTMNGALRHLRRIYLSRYFLDATCETGCAGQYLVVGTKRSTRCIIHSCYKAANSESTKVYPLLPVHQHTVRLTGLLTPQSYHSECDCDDQLPAPRGQIGFACF